MLELTLPALEHWDEKKEVFVTFKKALTLQFEHSLVSLSKWESKYCKPFLGTSNKTDEEILDYIKFMTITQNVKDDVYERLVQTRGAIEKIQKYIDAPMTATTFHNEAASKSSSERITAELIYYWMIAFQIPFECQKWHLNKLLTLVRVCEIKNRPQKKMKPQDVNARNAALNAERLKKLNTKG
ncbi:MAG: hypothetical protein J6Q60_05540 [Bacteroidaceae bacterium]|nr:hypothetical protein [Bacteroidaceae bacterium]